MLLALRPVGSTNMQFPRRRQPVSDRSRVRSMAAEAFPIDGHHALRGNLKND
jgi:hypothetical protein